MENDCRVRDTQHNGVVGIMADATGHVFCPICIREYLTIKLEHLDDTGCLHGVAEDRDHSRSFDVHTVTDLEAGILCYRCDNTSDNTSKPRIWDGGEWLDEDGIFVDEAGSMVTQLGCLGWVAKCAREGNLQMSVYGDTGPTDETVYLPRQLRDRRERIREVIDIAYEGMQLSHDYWADCISEQSWQLFKQLCDVHSFAIFALEHRHAFENAWKYAQEAIRSAAALLISAEATPSKESMVELYTLVVNLFAHCERISCKTDLELAG